MRNLEKIIDQVNKIKQIDSKLGANNLKDAINNLKYFDTDSNMSYLKHGMLTYNITSDFDEPHLFSHFKSLSVNISKGCEVHPQTFSGSNVLITYDNLPSKSFDLTENGYQFYDPEDTYSFYVNGSLDNGKFHKSFNKFNYIGYSFEYDPIEGNFDTRYGSCLVIPSMKSVTCPILTLNIDNTYSKIKYTINDTYILESHNNTICVNPGDKVKYEIHSSEFKYIENEIVVTDSTTININLVPSQPITVKVTSEPSSKYSIATIMGDNVINENGELELGSIEGSNYYKEYALLKFKTPGKDAKISVSAEGFVGRGNWIYSDCSSRIGILVSEIPVKIPPDSDYDHRAFTDVLDELGGSNSDNVPFNAQFSLGGFYSKGEFHICRWNSGSANEGIGKDFKNLKSLKNCHYFNDGTNFVFYNSENHKLSYAPSRDVYWEDNFDEYYPVEFTEIGEIVDGVLSLKEEFEEELGYLRDHIQDITKYDKIILRVDKNNENLVYGYGWGDLSISNCNFDTSKDNQKFLVEFPVSFEGKTYDLDTYEMNLKPQTEYYVYFFVSPVYPYLNNYKLANAKLKVKNIQITVESD